MNINDFIITFAKALKADYFLKILKSSSLLKMYLMPVK